jgi:hypothetical protein
MKEGTGADYSQVEFFYSWWSLLFSQELWGHIRYGVSGSPAVCRWKELGRIQIFWAITNDLQYPSYTPTWSFIPIEARVASWHGLMWCPRWCCLLWVGGSTRVHLVLMVVVLWVMAPHWWRRTT